MLGSHIRLESIWGAMTNGPILYLPLFAFTVLADAASLSICSRISRVTDLMGKIFGLHKTCKQHDTRILSQAWISSWTKFCIQRARVSTCMKVNLAQIPFFRIHKSSLGKNLEEVSSLFNRNRETEWVWTEIEDKRTPFIVQLVRLISLLNAWV